MKILFIPFLIFLFGCTSSAEKSSTNKEITTDCSQAHIREIQSNFDAAMNELNAAKAISDRDPTPENNAVTAAASVEVPIPRFKLENALSECSVK